MCGCACVYVTGDNGRHAPANEVVEAHGAVVDVSYFVHHAVDVQTLEEKPGEHTHVEELQQDGHDGTHKLQGAG